MAAAVTVAGVPIGELGLALALIDEQGVGATREYEIAVCACGMVNGPSLAQTKNWYEPSLRPRVSNVYAPSVHPEMRVQGPDVPPRSK
jgi:NaMN:DMB phosphoribosyltransferase